MGNSHGSFELAAEARRASERFDDCEIKVIRETFKDLCHLSGDNTRIDKETFLQYFPLPGLLGERLFAVFDKKNIGEVDYEEFVCGLAVTCRGSWAEKVEFIFNLYDVHGVGAVSRGELAALLNHVPKSVMKLGRALNPTGQPGAPAVAPPPAAALRASASPPLTHDSTHSMYALHLSMGANGGGAGAIGGGPRSEGSAEHDPRTDEEMSHVSDGDHGDSGHHHHHLPVPGGAGGGGGRGRASTATSSSETRTRRGETHHYLHHYEEFTNNDIVDQAFEECDLDHDGKLSFSEFRLWMERNPVVARFLQSVFPYDEYRDWCGDAKHLPFIHNRDMTAPSLASHSPPGTPTRSSSGGGGGDGDDAVRLLLRAKALTANVDVQEAIDRLVATLRAEAGVDDGVGGDGGRVEPPLPSASPPLPPMSPRSSRAMHHQTIAKKGFLAKRGHRLKSWMQRWYVLVGNCIYYYQHERDKAPRGVIFLAGSFVEPLHDDENERRGHWGLEITRSQEHGLRRCLYTNSKVERDKWVHELRRASEVVPVEEDFEIGEELGKGQFSRVCQCVNKHTLERKAVKIIEKETMDAEEKELLRAEIAIMKLVNHPNIIRMEAVYESRRHIFIVMELHSGGELFDRVNGRPRLTEDEAFCVIYPLIESVAYLHEMGIVHRDLKPENILCGQKVGDIKIADFGLSKLVLPDEIMKMPCGTLSYVAPEVLTLNGYGREADMWSVGTIMYLLLRGRLPFDIDGESREKIIERTINGTIDTDDAVWKALSQDARDLMLGLLNKDIKRRMSAKEALLHPWILSRVDRMDTEPETFDF